MNSIFKKARKDFHLSQEYIAKQLGISVGELRLIEAGYMTISEPIKQKLYEIYGLDDEIVSRKIREKLNHDDQEIKNLLHFKKLLKRKE
jgi:transcriptional regulator with XRE-family HTH domain